MEDSILVKGLTQLDAADLKHSLRSHNIETINSDRSGDTLHELGLATLVLAISGPAVGALTAWILKSREHEEFMVELEVIRPDGTKETLKIKSKALSEQAPDADILEKIALFFKVPIAQLKSVIASYLST